MQTASQPCTLALPLLVFPLHKRDAYTAERHSTLAQGPRLRGNVRTGLQRTSLPSGPPLAMISAHCHAPRAPLAAGEQIKHAHKVLGRDRNR